MARAGPRRFWDGRRVRRAAIAGYVLSLVLHWVLAPFSLFPEKSLDLVDVEGDLSIPADLLEEALKNEEPAPKPVENPQGDPNAGGAKAGAGADAGPDTGADAGVIADAGKVLKDAGGSDTGPRLALADAGAGQGDGGVLALGDAGAGNGSKGLLGAAGDVQAGPVNVQLLVNMEEIRKHPTGKKLGPLLSAIPQWDSFFKGTNVDPIRDTDWISIIGPSLRNTDRDVILVHYSASDAIMDKAIDTVTTQYAHGGPFDAGVRGLKAAIGTADRAQRVFLRPQAHVLAVVPPDFAGRAARDLSRMRVPAHVIAGEVVHLVLKDPKKHLPILPASISELRLAGEVRADLGLDLVGEADTEDAEKAVAAADEVQRLVRSYDSLGVRLVVGNLLGGFTATASGSKVKFKVTLQKTEIDALLGLLAGRLGVQLPP